MKKTILAILLCGVMVLGLTGCGNEKQSTKDELNNVNNKIIEYFSTYGVKDYKNYCFNYVDEENKTVIVGLEDNSKKEQEKFLKTIVDSDLIKFVKGNKLKYEINTPESDTEEVTFIRTYNILNVANSNDENYIYLTIRQFQSEEVQTIKVEKKLCPQIAEEKNYEFTIVLNKKTNDDILSIFNNGKIISINETDKIGLEQIQEDF